jgi:hypothetical protein
LDSAPNSRRDFFQQIGFAVGGVAASGRALGANERIRIGVIGYGARGSQITADAAGCPNTEIVAVTDIFTAQLAKALEGHTPTPPRAHMQNFLDCVRSGKETNCPFELGFRVSIACRMAVESYRQKRTLRWDPSGEEIV